jgi:hypothetical protein
MSRLQLVCLATAVLSLLLVAPGTDAQVLYGSLVQADRLI